MENILIQHTLTKEQIKDWLKEMLDSLNIVGYKVDGIPTMIDFEKFEQYMYEEYLGDNGSYIEFCWLNKYGNDISDIFKNIYNEIVQEMKKEKEKNNEKG